ncbi:MAG: non-canonical purine NTP pyrophosphatase [Candidatus Korarchaeum sp.]
MIELYFVSSNTHKYEEFRRMLSDIADLRFVEADYLEPQGEELEEIVVTSAKWLSSYIRGPFFIEDSGLFIDSLGGFPGPYSSYVFKKIGNPGILKLMEGIKEREATFISVIALVFQGRVEVFKGEAKGEIAESMRGRGWGFDPIFIPRGSGGLTYGELGERKDLFSHRGLSCRGLREFLREKIYYKSV